MLKGKISVITGGARGIGFAIAEKFAEHHSDIVIWDILDEGANSAKTLEEKYGIKAKFYKVDITDFETVKETAKKVIEEMGTPEVIVNNAGITRDTLLLRMKPEDWELVLKINLTGAFNTTKGFLQQMLKNRKGSIINIASVIGLMGNAGQANYAASKAGLIGFTKSLAKEIASRGLRANAIAPGFIETEMTKKLPEKVIEEYLKVIPLSRPGKPEDVANVALFLASDLSSYITGQTIIVDGGMLM